MFKLNLMDNGSIARVKTKDCSTIEGSGAPPQHNSEDADTPETIFCS